EDPQLLSTVGSESSKYQKGYNAQKPDFWVVMKNSDKILHEILFQETSGSPFVDDKQKHEEDR
ncbi:7895_t:CDS:2, partial [Entrophospora sp. SA101]